MGPILRTLGRSDSPFPISENVHCLVDSAEKSPNGSPFPSTSSKTFPNHGSLSSRMGGTHRLPTDSGQVVEQRTTLSYKHVRTAGSSSSPQGIPSIDSVRVDINTDGQYDHHVLLKQTRWDMLSPTVPGIAGDLALTSGQESVDHSGTLARRTERADRRSVGTLKNSKTGCSTRRWWQTSFINGVVHPSISLQTI